MAEVAVLVETILKLEWHLQDQKQTVDGVKQLTRGLMKIKDQLGADVIFNENTQPSDYEKILREYAKEGCQVVIGHGYEFTDGAKIVAEEFPDVKFIVTGTDIGNGKNLGSIQNNYYQSGFLQGVFATNMSEAGVGGQEIPPIKNDILGYDAGAKYAKADVQVLTAMTGSFDDANKLKEQSLSLMNQGADIVMVDADHGGYDAAKEKGALCYRFNCTRV